MDLPHLTAVERSAEVCRFILTKLEYWLSPSGHFREFTKMNARIAISIAIPVLMVAPLVTMALRQFQTWTTMLTSTVSEFVLFPLSVVLSILLVCGLIYIGRSILEMRLRGQQRERYY